MSAAVLERRHLAASVGVVRAQLEQLARRKRGEADEPEALAAAEALLASAQSELAAPPLDAFATSFGLDAFERALLLLCAGAELDPNWGALCAAAGDASRSYPHFALAFEAFDDPDWSALAPGATLRRWHIVECARQSGFASDRLTLDERVLHHLLRSGSLDARLAGLAQPVPSPEAFADAPGARSGGTFRADMAGRRQARPRDRGRAQRRRAHESRGGVRVSGPRPSIA